MMTKKFVTELVFKREICSLKRTIKNLTAIIGNTPTFYYQSNSGTFPPNPQPGDWLFVTPTGDETSPIQEQWAFTGTVWYQIPISSQKEYCYNEWTDFPLVIGDNKFDISDGSADYTDFIIGYQAVSKNLLKNSVSVDIEDNEEVFVIKALSTTQFIVYSAIEVQATITVKYPVTTI